MNTNTEDSQMNNYPKQKNDKTPTWLSVPLLITLLLALNFTACTSTGHFMTQGEVKYIRPKVQPFLQKEDTNSAISAYGGISFGKPAEEQLTINAYDAGDFHTEYYEWPAGKKDLRYQTEANGLDLALQYEPKNTISFLLMGTAKKVSSDYLGSAYGVIRLKGQWGRFTLGSDLGGGAQRTRQSIDIVTIKSSPYSTGQSMSYLALFPDTTLDEVTVRTLRRVTWGRSIMWNVGASYDFEKVSPYLTLSVLDLPKVLSSVEVPPEAYVFEVLSWDAGIAVNSFYKSKIIIGISAQKINQYNSGSDFSGSVGFSIGL